MNYRRERMASLVREELAMLIARELEFKDMFVTLTSVDVNDDLDSARAMLSVIPADRAADALAIARKFERRFHGDLVRKLSIRPIPQIRFVIDHGLEKAADIEKRLMGSDTSGE